jgi:hypothetical protein
VNGHCPSLVPALLLHMTELVNVSEEAVNVSPYKEISVSAGHIVESIVEIVSRSLVRAFTRTDEVIDDSPSVAVAVSDE